MVGFRCIRNASCSSELLMVVVGSFLMMLMDLMAVVLWRLLSSWSLVDCSILLISSWMWVVVLVGAVLSLGWVVMMSCMASSSSWLLSAVLMSCGSSIKSWMVAWFWSMSL